MVGRPSGNMWVLKQERKFGLWTPFKHAFPNITHPRSSRCPHGEFPLPFPDSRTLWSGGTSLPISRRMSLSGLTPGIWSAIERRWGWTVALVVDDHISLDLLVRIVLEVDICNTYLWTRSTIGFVLTDLSTWCCYSFVLPALLLS